MLLKPLIALLPVMISIGCSGEIRVIPKDRLFDGKKRILYRSLDYDWFGRPVFAGEVKSKPSSAHDHYFAVDAGSDGRLIRSFQIFNSDIAGEKIDPVKPLYTVFRWTGKGFMVGLDVAGEILKAPASSRDGAVLQVQIAGLTVIMGTAGGFAIGVIKSIDDAVDTMQVRFAGFREAFVGYMRYFYDDAGRIMKMVHYTPTDEPSELVVVIYEYRGNSRDPEKTVFTSIPEKKTRTISHTQKLQGETSGPRDK